MIITPLSRMLKPHNATYYPTFVFYRLAMKLVKFALHGFVHIYVACNVKKSGSANRMTSR